MDFNTLCTNENRKKCSIGNYKICNSTTTVSLHYLRKHTKQHDHGWPLPALRSIEPIVRNLRRKSSSIHRFQFLLEYFLNNLVAENVLHSHRFLIKILSSKLNIRPIIHLHSKHSWHAMWHNYDVITEPLSKWTEDRIFIPFLLVHKMLKSIKKRRSYSPK